MSCGVGHRRGLDLMLLWLCLWLCLWLAGTAPIRPLAGEPQYAVGVALKDKGPPPKKKTIIQRYKNLFKSLIIKICRLFPSINIQTMLATFYIHFFK